jgi:WD40 repeat protein
VQVWNLDTLQPAQTLNRHTSSVNALIWQRGKLLSGAADNTIKVCRASLCLDGVTTNAAQVWQ